MSFRPIALLLEERLLCSLQPILNTRHFPYSAVAHVDVVYDSNDNARVDFGDARAEASAVMIGPDTALTSAHVVYDARLGGLALRVWVTPGEVGSFRPFGTFAASSWAVPDLYANPAIPDSIGTASDLAVLNFKPIRTSHGVTHVGDLTGWMTPRALSDRTLHGLTVTNVGYPADTFSGTVQFRSSGPILDSRERGGIGFFSFSNLSIPIQEGSSGSPLFHHIPGTGTIVVGLTESTLLGDELNLATKITSRLLSFIHTAQKLRDDGGHILGFRYARSPAGGGLPIAVVDAVFAARHAH